MEVQKMKHELKMLPPEDNFRTVRILEQLARTNRALAELKGYARTIPNQHILINAITINEAKDSSEIENIVTTHDEIYKAMTQSNYKNESAKEVVDYRSAIWRGYNLVKEKEIITTNILVEIQSIIEHNNAGIRKIPGTVLKNSKTGEIVYTPPETEKEVREYLKNLEEYINTDDMIDPLIKLAIIHYQFESIHPFYDGNGRTGRILNILYLVLKDLLDSPILYLSRYINDNKQTYYKLFKEVRETNNFEEWIIYINQNRRNCRYRDKVDKNKDIVDYLKDNTKNELLSLYLLYGYAGNNEYIVEEIIELKNKKKEEIIKRIINFLDNQIVSILQFFNNKRIEDIKNIAYNQEFYEFSKNKENNISLDTIKILKQLKFIYCKKEKNGIIIHMPKFIRDKIHNICGNLYLDYYEAIISYSKGIADTYGAIHIQEAYDIIKNDILISFEKYDNIIKFVSLLELEPIYYSFEYQCLCSFNLRDDRIAEILKASKYTVIYDKKMYEDIGNDNYVINLKEYKEFRNYLKEYYKFDINEDEMLRGEIVCDYIDNAQLDEKEAKENVKDALDRYFEIDDLEKQVIIGYIDKIRKKMPIWKQGGKIDNTVQFNKVGRNEPCSCGSRKEI